MTTNNIITTERSLTIRLPDGEHLLIQKSDWDRLRRDADLLSKGRPAFWANAAWMCAGVSITAFLGFLTLCLGGAEVNPYLPPIYGCAAAAAALVGLFCFRSHRYLAQQTVNMANLMGTHMDDIAKTFSSATPSSP